MESNSLMEILTRKEARDRGLGIYFNGPCKKGHTGGRYTSNGSCIDCVRAFAQAKPEVNKAAVASYQTKNKDKMRAYAKKWREKNKHTILMYKVRYKRAEGFFTDQDIKEKLERQGHSCNICLRDFGPDLRYEVDHIKPLSKGGTNWPSNLQMLCRNCNAQKSNKYEDTSEEEMEDWLEERLENKNT